MDATIGRASHRPKHCAECGGRLGEADAYCGGCGTPVGSGTAPKPAPATVAPSTAPVQVRTPVAAQTGEFDRTTFVSVLALGSVWALLHARRGALRRGWPALLGALLLLGAFLTWGSTFLQTFDDPYYVLFQRGSIRAALLAAFALRLVLALPMALWAARRPELAGPRQARLRNLGLAGLGLLLVVVGGDALTAGTRADAATRAVAAKVYVEVLYRGRNPRDRSEVGYTLYVKGPRLWHGTVPMRLLVREANGRTFDAGLGKGVGGSDVHEYWGDTEITFSARGDHPTFTLVVAGEVAEKGDLQEWALGWRR